MDGSRPRWYLLASALGGRAAVMGRREHGWRRPARRVATRAGDERGALASDGWRERVHGARARRDGGAPANNGRPACSGRGWTVFQVPTGWTVFQTPSTPWASFNRPMGDVWARLESHGVLDGWTSTPRQEDTPLQLMGLGMPW